MMMKKGGGKKKAMPFGKPGAKAAPMAPMEKPMGMARGGMVRGAGAATKGKKYSSSC